MPPAIVYAEYGGPEVLTPVDRPIPAPGPDQVLVRVHAVGLNPFDAKRRRGLFASKPPAVPRLTGGDLAGVVEAVGPDVTGFADGDRVVGQNGAGSTATYVAVAASALTALPEDIDFVTGAAIPVPGRTAIRVLGLAGVQLGESLLLHAASGGVGSFTGQLAVSRGVQVVGTASEHNQEYLRTLGVIPVVYGAGWLDRVRAAHPQPFDAVVDAAGTGVIEGSLQVVRPGAPVVTINDFSAAGPGVVITSSDEGFEGSLAEAVRAVVSGAVRVDIAQTFPLARTADAYRLLEGGHAPGKIVVTLD